MLNYVKQYVDLCRYSRKDKNHTEIHNWHHLFMLRICFSLCGSYLGALSTPSVKVSDCDSGFSMWTPFMWGQELVLKAEGWGLGAFGGRSIDWKDTFAD